MVGLFELILLTGCVDVRGDDLAALRMMRRIVVYISFMDFSPHSIWGCH